MTRTAGIIDRLQKLAASVEPLRGQVPDRVKNDLYAAIFALSRRPGDRTIVCVIGGTGTGKSTLVNRLVGRDVTATSYRRTFTAGPVAVVADSGRVGQSTGGSPAPDRTENDFNKKAPTAGKPLPPTVPPLDQPPQILPSQFSGLSHVTCGEVPAKGRTDRLTVIAADSELLERITLIDTPDIDGEFAEHHGLADRVVRWADGVVFVVSPEKYQMPELQPYYRLAERYAVPAIYLMNKADNAEVVADYAALLGRAGLNDAQPHALARDDSTWQPPGSIRLDKEVVASLRPNPQPAGQTARIHDVLGRMNDAVLQPMRDRRRHVDRLVEAVRGLAGGSVEVDVHPLTHQLQRRMREQSVLYLMGPQRILDRVRSVPSMIVRLPRTMWKWTQTGELSLPTVDDLPPPEPLDFEAVLVEQFQGLQSRLDDLLRTTPVLQEPTTNPAADWKIDPARAATIAREELDKLRQWLETRWNATPRDTAVLNKLLKVIPGAGKKLGKYSEAAPYLLAIACLTHSAMLGHMDLVVLGGYSAFTWLTQRLSDEVAARTRATNAAMADRYEKLAADQINKTVAWLQGQAPPVKMLDHIGRLIEGVRAELD